MHQNYVLPLTKYVKKCAVGGV